MCARSIDLLPEEVTVQPGERIEVHCSYDSSEKDEVTEGGDETRDEMCLSFLLYYPKREAAKSDPGLAFCASEAFPVLSDELVIEE